MLYNKREFRETDRVCERHFDRSQILTHWEHIIKGEIHQIEREKPKIKADAIPYLNLPDTEDAPHNTQQKRPHKEPKKRKQNLSAHHKNKVNYRFICSILTNSSKSESEMHVFCNLQVVRKGEDIECSPMNDIDIYDGIEIKREIKSPRSLKSSPCKAKAILELSDEEKHQIFDGVYDDVYEVVLPNTLWGKTVK